jgi:hypothetical protein
VSTDSLSRRKIFTLFGGSLLALTGLAATTQEAAAQALERNDIKVGPRRPSGINPNARTQPGKRDPRKPPMNGRRPKIKEQPRFN